MNENKTMNLKNQGADAVARAATAVMIEKKGMDVRLYEVGESNPLTDFYLNVTGRSHSHVASLADDLAEKLAELGLDALRVEGRRGDGWILVDYGNVIVNVFDRESREFYNLDRLMPAETSVDISDIVKEVDNKLEIKNIEE